MHERFHRALAQDLLTYLTDYRAAGADNLLLFSVSFDVPGLRVKDQLVHAAWSCIANLGAEAVEPQGSYAGAITSLTLQQQRRPAKRPIVSGVALVCRDAFSASEPAAYLAAAAATDDTVHAIRWDSGSETPDQQSGAANTVDLLDTETLGALGPLLHTLRAKP